MAHREIAAALSESETANRERLAALVRIPSISAKGHDPGEVRRSAEATATLLKEAGVENVRLIESAGSPPYVYGDWMHAPGDAPTLLLYSHHDVQPVPAPDEWTSGAFDPTVRDGRLYGRGAADDKAGVIVHASAVEAWLAAHGRLPVNVKLIVEGEEEVGSPHLDAFLSEHTETLSADVVVVADLANFKLGWPSLTYLLRGISEVYVTVRALKKSVHSMYSGAAPDALSGLMVALTSLKDARGGIAVPGFSDDARRPTDEERELIRSLETEDDDPLDGILLDGVETVADPDLSLRERMWTQPAITVIGIDVPSVIEATNQLVAEARAKISIRLAPGQDPRRAAGLVAAHVRANVPWGLHCETVHGAMAAGWVCEPKGASFEAARRALTKAYGREPALLGIGGTIPFVTRISEALRGAPCLLTAIADPDCRAHGVDESVDLGDLSRACLAEAILFDELSRG